MTILFNQKITPQQIMTLSHVQSFVAKKLQHDFSGHDIAHIERVVRLAKYILQTEPDANPFIVILSAYLHDIIDEKVASDVNQANISLHQLLDQQKISMAVQDAIFDVINNMSYRKNLTQKQVLSLEGMIVQDADRLDAIGAIGIGRTFYYGGNKHTMMHDVNILPRTALDENNYRKPSTVINHFYEKLFLLKEQMNTDAAKKLAKKRHLFLVQFVQQFENEWLGTFDDEV